VYRGPFYERRGELKDDDEYAEDHGEDLHYRHFDDDRDEYSDIICWSAHIREQLVGEGYGGRKDVLDSSGVTEGAVHKVPKELAVEDTPIARPHSVCNPSSLENVHQKTQELHIQTAAVMATKCAHSCQMRFPISCVRSPGVY
jgi:hypothetical protein